MVDLDRYIEKEWNEIASFPAWFSKGCRNTKAKYTDMGKFVEVNNSCDVKGKRKVQIGKAFPTDDENVLKVQFFAPFKAPYKIEFIDDDYQNAIVGSGKGYLWILSRDEQISDEKYQELVEIAKKKGYNTDKLVKTGK